MEYEMYTYITFTFYMYILNIHFSYFIHIVWNMKNVYVMYKYIRNMYFLAGITTTKRLQEICMEYEKSICNITLDICHSTRTFLKVITLAL
jgi:hypothetical protein